MNDKPRIAAGYQPTPNCLQDRVILITGAGDGIGKAVAVAAAVHGAQVILLGRTSQKLEATYDDIEALDAPEPGIAVFDFEQADGTAYEHLVTTLTDTYGRLDGIAHIAGQLGTLTPFEHADITEWQRVLHVNLTAQVVLTKVCLPLLAAAEKPSIVFTSSSVGRKGRAYWGAYAVSKFATEGFAQVLAAEQSNSGMRVNTINPGATRTGMRLAAYPAEDRDLLATPDEIAPMFVWFLGSDSEAINGKSVDAQPK